MSIEVKTDEEFFEMFLWYVNDHVKTKMISTLDKHGQPLDLFKVSWNATLAEEQGFDPLIAHAEGQVDYFIMISKRTKLTGYLYFNPRVH